MSKPQTRQDTLSQPTSEPLDQGAPPKVATPGQPPLRLEWIEAGSLTENPHNWRRHSPEQLQSIRDLLSDPDIGWAGACLYNERTKRLIDGHARKTVADPKTPVPVLVGNWSEDAEKKILATLDPVCAMAQGDADAYAALVATINAESLWVRDLLHNTQAGLNAVAEDDEEQPTEPSAVLPQMECQPFEHHDYIMLIFKNEQDFQQACERLGIQRVQVTYPGGQQKIGLGRCIDGAKAMGRFASEQAVPGGKEGLLEKLEIDGRRNASYQQHPARDPD